MSARNYEPVKREMSFDQYQNPLISRYASPEMSGIWSAQRKFSTWRRLWVALAEAEHELGLPVTPAQIEQLREHIDDVDFENAARHERRLRHDVMAHVEAYGEVCPAAKSIIHLGATSCFVTDNTDLMLLRDALEMVRDRLVAVIDSLARFAEEHRDLACLGYTHLQPAQPTTVGKRACLWAYDLGLDLEEIEHRLIGPPFLPDRMPRAHRPGLVDIAHRHTAEDRPIGVRIPRHHHRLDRQVALVGYVVHEIALSLETSHNRAT